MNTKIPTSFLFAVLLATTFVIAAVSMTISPTTLEFTNQNQALDITLTNNVADDATVSISGTTSVTDGTNTVNFGLSQNNFVVPGNSQGTVTITATGDPQLLEFGDYSTTLTVDATDGVDTIPTTVTLKAISGFCSAGAVGGNLRIKNVDINNRDGDDDEWVLLDEIEIEVEVENDGDDEIEDVIIELGLFDSSGNNVIDDMDFDNTDEEEIDVGDIDDDDEEEVTFRFRIPADFDDGIHKLAIKAYGDDVGEDVECVDSSNDLRENFFETIDIDREDDEENFIVVDDIVIDEQASCGDLVSGSFTVFNIGDEDQERVLITMKNLNLGLDQQFEITQDLDEGDDETLSFSFQVPSNAEEKVYTISFRTEYDYKKVSEDTFTGFVNVIGCGLPIGPGDTSVAGSVIISASLESDAIAGEELVVSSRLTNAGIETITATVDARAFQSWANLDSISPRTVTLVPGGSQTVTMTFKVDADASGAQSFVIETNANGRIDVQEVEVNLEDGASGAGITGFTGLDLGGDNSLIWVIAIVNIILIILIIIVAVRLSRR